MASGPRPPRPPGDRPSYTRYRARPRLFGRGETGNALDTLRRREPKGARRGSPAGRKPITPRRVARWVTLALAGWIVLSIVLFLVSAQIESGKLSGAVDGELDGGFPLTSKSTLLVLGSDARVKGQAEPGAQTIGAPSRSDSILLIRTGAGASARLSIPRDTVVDIPGHGRDKINAAFAFGGAALSVRTIKQYLGIEINHVIEVDFANFPKLVDSMGGIDFKGGCVFSKINGGRANGGYTLRLKAGEHHIDGKQALALARTRHNLCRPAEDDLTRARRQQKILAAIKSRTLSPWTLIRLPWVAWNAPQAIRSDMGGPSLLGLVGALSIAGSPRPQILRPEPGGVTLPDGGAGLVVSRAERQREVSRFLRG